jgi:hypothetical protein
MRVVIFLICLGYLLLGGYNYIHIGSHQNTITQQKFTHRAVIKKATPEKEAEYLIMDEEEDDETNNSFVRKYILLARGYLTLFDQSNLSDRYNCPGAPPNYCSPRYITQGALRI